MPIKSYCKSMSQEDYFAEEFIIFNRCLMIVLEFMSFGFVWWCFPISCYNLHVLTVRCGKIPHVYFGKKESWSHFKLNVPSEMSKNAANLSEVWQMWPQNLCVVWVGHDASTLFEFTDARTAPSNVPWRTELVTRKPIGCGFGKCTLPETNSHRDLKMDDWKTTPSEN